MTLSNNDETDDAPSGSIESHIKSLHDVKASLAILNGYGESLSTSFTELCDHMDSIVIRTTLKDDMDAIGQLKTLEADCRFCLSRIRASTDQLKEHLEVLKTGEQ